ncbi:MAG: sigma-54 dependent transcriptional regulator [Thermoanaerobaculia bacterium]|jgi:DNA-binding NtrC family response regulator|nr:sigma-54 dependent transcriptional regulator [Thermoanaerobaculia bacterium]
MAAEILLVEDRESLRSMLAETLGGEGYRVEAVATGDEAVRRLSEGRRYALVLTDLKLPGADGLAVLDAALANDPSVPVVLLTGYGTVETAVAAMKRGAADFLNKPVDVDLLLLLVKRHVEARRSAVARALLAEEAGLAGMPRILGRSPALADALERLRRAAPSDVTVLLTGESGTGKELFARALHALSPRRAGPFVAVNVAALPEGLVENELFGHEKGAYTGAGERRAGRFELADGGTLFLDEIGELPLGAQTKLLRAVEERTFLRVGGTVPLSVDVRLVVATNRDLAARVKAGAFREDLYYRLDVFPVKLPPLRARREDVPELARAFARSSGEGARGRAFEIGAGAAEKLAAWDWPGNVRELKNVVERAVLLAEGPVIRPADVVLGAPGEDAPTTPTLDGTLEETAERWRRAGEAARIRRALEEAGGDRTAAAAALDIPLKRLAQRLRDLKL